MSCSEKTTQECWHGRRVGAGQPPGRPTPPRVCLLPQTWRPRGTAQPGPRCFLRLRPQLRAAPGLKGGMQDRARGPVLCGFLFSAKVTVPHAWGGGAARGLRGEGGTNAHQWLEGQCELPRASTRGAGDSAHHCENEPSCQGPGRELVASVLCLPSRGTVGRRVMVMLEPQGPCC